MAKVLTAARVRVPPANEPDYLATLRDLCQFAEARGQRIWVFRNAKDPQLFTEFSESPTEMRSEERRVGKSTGRGCGWVLGKKRYLAAVSGCHDSKVSFLSPDAS